MRGLMSPGRPRLVAVLALLMGGCAHTGGTGEPPNPDPWEPFNRSIFQFNEKVDQAVVKPVAEGYRKVMPDPVRKGVGNVFRNLAEPTTIVNGVLQGKFKQAGNDFLRFAVNSTVGLLGWFDPATRLGLEHHEEDFGQTFSVWGFARGPYLVLPLLGPSTVTDGVGIVPSTLYTDPRYAAGYSVVTYTILAVDTIDSRARLLGASKVVDLQLDPYVFRRETYLQRRMQLIHDGDPPQEDDALEDEWLEEDWLDDELSDDEPGNE